MRAFQCLSSPRKFLRLEEGGSLLRQPIGSPDVWRNGESRPIKNNFLTDFLLKELKGAFFSVSQFCRSEITKQIFFIMILCYFIFFKKLFIENFNEEVIKIKSQINTYNGLLINLKNVFYPRAKFNFVI